MNWFNRLLGRKQEVDDFAVALPAATHQPAVTVPYRFSNAELVIAAFGDLHGRLDLLQRHFPLLDKLAQAPDRKLIEVYVGDYVDRGPNSALLIELMIERQRLQDRSIIYLRGNHEDMMLAALDDDAVFKQWVKFGGDTTMLSYGVSPNAAAYDVTGSRLRFKTAVPQAHVEFLSGLQDYYVEGGFLFVHAGLRPGVPLSSQQKRDLHWIREPFLSSSSSSGYTVVHGHTPTSRPTFRLNRIGIDTGAYQTGNLTCLVISNDGVVAHETGR